MVQTFPTYMKLAAEDIENKSYPSDRIKMNVFNNEVHRSRSLDALNWNDNMLSTYECNTDLQMRNSYETFH